MNRKKEICGGPKFYLFSSIIYHNTNSFHTLFGVLDYMAQNKDVGFVLMQTQICKWFCCFPAVYLTNSLTKILFVFPENCGKQCLVQSVLLKILLLFFFAGGLEFAVMLLYSLFISEPIDMCGSDYSLFMFLFMIATTKNVLEGNT